MANNQAEHLCVKGLRSNLLGFPVIMSLELMARDGETVHDEHWVDGYCGKVS